MILRNASYVVLLLALFTSTEAAELEQARTILDESGVKGGVVVHVGCGDGKLTAALRAGEGFLVHGLDTDPANVEQALCHAREAGLRGWVSVSRFDGSHLPFIDGMVNLVVVEAGSGVPQEEILRVLAPGGVACIRKGEKWEKAVKPVPAEIDEWSHFLHGADGNAVAKDSIVDSPFHIQWIGSPSYSRDHEMASSMDVMVSAGGRLFYIMDEGSRANPRGPSRWLLVARDAFNGVVLWKRPMPVWRVSNYGYRKTQAADMWRRLVATEDAVYVTTNIFGPVEALDPATGKTIRTYAGTEKVEEIIHEDGILYLVATTLEVDKIDRRALGSRRNDPDTKRLMAVKADAGEILWTKEDEDTHGVHPLTLAAGDGGVFFQNSHEVICLAPKTGQVVWLYGRPSPYARLSYDTPLLIVQEDVVLSADRRVTPRVKGRESKAEEASEEPEGSCEMIALSTAEGKELWRCFCDNNVGSGPDVFVAQGLVWVGEYNRRDPCDYNRGRDLHTGEIKRVLAKSDDWPMEHHHRCYRDKATERFILSGRQGIEFRDLESGVLTPNSWLRGICQYGILPCNGLVYSPPDQCGCYIESKLAGFHALAPKRSKNWEERGVKDDARLQTGPAYKGALHPSDFNLHTSSDWSTYRSENSRSSFVQTELPPKLKPAWKTELSAGLTSLSSVGGRVYVASKDTHCVYCLEAATGNVVWSYLTGGRVDSPPSINRGMVVFGCRDGWVYALRASDGEEVWRFRAAPVDLRLVDNDRIESVWPVHGSVVIADGAVHFSAGRSSYFDGGITLYKLDLATGELLTEKRVSSRDPETGKRFDLYTPFAGEVLPGREMPGLLQDVLSYDEKYFYMRSVPLNSEFEIQDKVYVPHVFSSVGFLDDSWWERSYWTYGVHFYSGARGHGYSMTLNPSGDILVFDEDTVFGYLSHQGTGIFSVPKNPPIIDLKEAVARDKHTKKAEEATGKKADLSGLDVYVWKDGIPQNPDRMNMSNDAGYVGGPHGRTVRRLMKYEYDWTQEPSLYPYAMLVTDKAFVMAGPPRPEVEKVKGRRSDTVLPTVDHFSSDLGQQNAPDIYDGSKGSMLQMVDKTDGTELSRTELPSTPVFDGMIAANGRVFLSLKDGSVLCLVGE